MVEVKPNGLLKENFQESKNHNVKKARKQNQSHSSRPAEWGLVLGKPSTTLGLRDNDAPGIPARVTFCVPFLKQMCYAREPEENLGRGVWMEWSQFILLHIAKTPPPVSIGRKTSSSQAHPHNVARILMHPFLFLPNPLAWIQFHTPALVIIHSFSHDPFLFFIWFLDNIVLHVNHFSLLLLLSSDYLFPPTVFTGLFVISAASLLLEVILISIFFISHYLFEDCLSQISLSQGCYLA